jgi:hypothetical protein
MHPALQPALSHHNRDASSSNVLIPAGSDLISQQIYDILAMEEDYTIEGPVTESVVFELLKAGKEE